MADALTVRATWWTRLLRGVGLLPSGEAEHIAGADYAMSSPAGRSYDVAASMAAYAQFPWVQACVQAISSDLSGLPIRLVRGSGADSELVDDHPMIDLLRQPSSRVDGITFRRQLVTDLALVGDAFALIVGDGEPAALLRLHPHRVAIRPWADGQPGAFEYSGVGVPVVYAWDEVLHVRTPSWSDGPESLYGSGAIEALQRDLSTDYSAAVTAANTAKIGRPTGVFSPKSDGDFWSQDQVRIMREAYEKQMAGKSGALFLGGPASYQALSWSPAEMEYSELRRSVREAVLAAFDVPPARVGLPNTNYATASAQSRRYWEGLKARAAIVDASLTRIARMWGDDLRVFHDFADVEPLAENRSARLDRVQSWWMMGVPLAEAAEIEGFDLPETDTPPPPAAEEPEEERSALGIFQLFMPDAQTEWTYPEEEEERATVWRSWLDRVHSPAERPMAIEMRRYLRNAAERTAKRLAKVLGGRTGIQRTIGETELRKIWAEAEEAAELGRVSRDRLRASMMKAFRESARLLPVADLVFEPVRIDRAVDRALGDLVQNVGPTTKSAVNRIVRDGLDEGLSIGQMQEQLMSSPQFSASRALRIARTETTRSVSAGSLQAYQAAANLGLNIRVEWLTARDGGERHPSAMGGDGKPLDGQTIELGGVFILDDGASGSGPGDLGEPSHDINCRCTTIPIVERAS